MQERLQEAEATGETQVAHYQFDTVDVSLLVPFGAQEGLSLGLAARGHRDHGDLRRGGSAHGARSISVRADLGHAPCDGRPRLVVGVLPTGNEPELSICPARSPTRPSGGQTVGEAGLHRGPLVGQDRVVDRVADVAIGQARVAPSTPSRTAPRRSIARCDRSLRPSVFSATRPAPRVSKA